MNDEIILDEYVDEEFNTWARGCIQYPCVFIRGITSNDEIEFFRKRKCDEKTSVHAYVDVNGEPISLGKLDLTLHSLLTLRSIYPYEVELCTGVNNSTVIDINDPDTLIKFIKL